MLVFSFYTILIPRLTSPFPIHTVKKNFKLFSPYQPMRYKQYSDRCDCYGVVYISSFAS